MSDKEKSILQQIHAFKRKYVINLLLRGLLITGSLLMMLFLLFNYLEYSFQFGIDLRTLLFFSFIASAVALLAYYVAIPAYKLLKVDQALDNEFAARHIGRYFPEIRDKLINIIQLRTLSSKGSLAYAGLEQKMNSMPEVKFTEAIDTRPTTSLLPWFGGPLLIFLLVILIKPDVITESSTRIVNYGEAYIPQAPFYFVLQNQSLEVFRNDDLTLILKLTGEAIADQVFISIGGRKLQMQTAGSGSFEYTLKKVQKTINFHFQAAGYDSKSFNVSVLNRPDLKTFNLYLDYPRYLNKQNEVLANTGNINIPEGTRATWQISAGFTDSVTFTFGDQANTVKAQSNNGLFELDRTIKERGRYQINLYNEHGQNKDLLQYQLDVIPDMHPKIQNTAYQDTILYSFITLGGNISDDYGLSQLSLFYKTRDGEYSQINIPIDRSQPSQRYYYQWPLDSLLISSKELNYYLQVWDNDGVNGRKSAKTAIYTFQMPDKSDLKENLDKVSQQTEENIDRTLQEAKELREELKEAENRIKGKKELSWQDQKQIKDLIKKREELNQAIEELKQQNQLNQEKRNRFNKSNQQLKEKSEKLQELMNELLDDETKKLYEELKKLLEEKSEVEDIQDLVDKLNNKETNLEQELERTLELFKRMKVEHDLNQAIEELKDQIEQQEQLLNETEQAIDPEEEKYEEIEHQEENQLNNDSNNNQEQNNNLSDKQDQLKDSFEELKEDLEQLNKDNQSLKNPESLPDTQEEQDEVEKSQQQSSENLKENKKSQSRENQKNARDAMKKMVEKMEQMQASMEMQAMQENLDDLRSIVYNLIQLSFDQEGLMEEFASVKQSDPRFVG